MMQNAVIVLLKLLLATVTGTGAQGSQLSTGGMAPPLGSPTQDMPPQQEALPPPTKEEIDIARHREITSKAVSAIILLLLKWFKASHILKFHHLTQLLLDSNCLVLVLKIFGLQELSQMVQTKNEMPECSFFQYLHLNASKAAREKTAEPEPPVENSVKVTEENGEEVEVITDYSWRNFFAAINLVKILQKITKHRVHRILLMCQYKSSAILKRVLRVNHPMLQLQVLKLVKSQMPYFGRKWRSSELQRKLTELTCSEHEDHHLDLPELSPGAAQRLVSRCRSRPRGGRPARRHSTGARASLPYFVLQQAELRRTHGALHAR